MLSSSAARLASVPGLPRSVRVLIMRRRQTFENRLRIIKTRTERGSCGPHILKDEGYAGLSNIAFGIMAMSPENASCERAFSIMKYIINALV